MNIGIVCYASVGGSGIVATELGKALARRGHQVHFISTETPFRLGEFQAGLCVSSGADADVSAVSRAAVSAVARETGSCRWRASSGSTSSTRHYAVPHATAAFLSRQVLASTNGDGSARRHDAAWHGHHACRQRSLVFADRGVSRSSSRIA